MKIARVIYFQSLWFFIIYCGKEGNNTLALSLATISVLLDYYLFIQRYDLKKWLTFLFAVVASGIMIDTTLLKLDFIEFTAHNGAISPPFMWAMWIIFVPYYDIGLSRFSNKKLMSILLAFIFAPISYYSGTKQGALSIESYKGLLAVGILWAIYFPLSLKVFKWVRND